MKKQLEIIGSLVGWFAIIAQLILMLQNRQVDLVETLIRFFSFFTILTNLLVALYFTAKALNLSGLLKVFEKSGYHSSLTAYILLVGIVYLFALRHLWDPQGLQLLVDELLHTIIPLYAFFYWFKFSEREEDRFTSLRIWLLYPIIYFIFIIIRGWMSDYYPYPFLDMKKVGVVQFLLNVGLIFASIILIKYFLIFIGKRRKHNTQ